ncbi:hypothetical protein [Halostagnicola kamekurae]|uniref:Uncharacterized protein n=1 Tax=Halostagnicola kamekurae TaxID=619731 RepID=A0A1I6SS92_9EURY|nr:hypothetical protein [Halostagnicola kamekurae]SFS79738.1 hypothetical protein SAMN04488556_2873 [Halostagnicola kamekurae]
MANVNAIEGIRYGFRLMGYIVVVYLIGALLSFIGVGMIDSGSEIIGGLLALIGIVAILAGFLGMGYKVIADGVEKGINAANSGSSSGGNSLQPSQSDQRLSNLKQK